MNATGRNTRKPRGTAARIASRPPAACAGITPGRDFHAGQPYIVRLHGEGLTLRDHMVVRQAIVVKIEADLRGPARAARCYHAWSRQRDGGHRWMDSGELANARAWQRSWDRAVAMAAGLLSGPAPEDFGVELIERAGAG